MLGELLEGRCAGDGHHLTEAGDGYEADLVEGVEVVVVGLTTHDFEEESDTISVDRF